MNADGTVVVEKLVKVYGGGVRAVDGIEVAVEAGEFFGFLGPNGAGKTTTMKILSTLLRKSSGRAVVAGFDVDKHPDDVRRSIGFAMQEVGLDDLATGHDFLRLQGALYGLPRRSVRRRADEVLELVGLTSVAGRKVGTYSGGMRRRIDLAAALMHSPPLLFLDEPTTGLDPQSRLAVWEHLRTLNESGVTVFLTTQMMEEAERLCRRLAIIDRGRIVAEGSPKSLKANVGGDIVQVTIRPRVDGPGNGDVATARDLLGSRPYVSSVTGTGDALSVAAADGGAIVPDIVSVLRENEISIADLSIVTPTLDDVFLRYTGRSIRDEDASNGEADQIARQWLGLSDRR